MYYVAHEDQTYLGLYQHTTNSHRKFDMIFTSWVDCRHISTININLVSAIRNVNCEMKDECCICEHRAKNHGVKNHDSNVNETWCRQSESDVEKRYENNEHMQTGIEVHNIFMRIFNFKCWFSEIEVQI